MARKEMTPTALPPIATHVQHSPIFTIPSELRSEIYSYCSPLTLLIMTHTCHLFYTEINNHRSLLKSIIHKFPQKNASVSHWDEPNAIAKFDVNPDKPTSHDPHAVGLPTGMLPLSIPLLNHFDCLSPGYPDYEDSLFVRVYGAPRDAITGWSCCLRCRLAKVKFYLDYEHEAHNWKRGDPICHDCKYRPFPIGGRTELDHEEPEASSPEST
ncbi:hypothetical protein BJ508DRAFT_373208 [Ascobolus immersus RN42]|uniref:F-box domain-containing protein n=1 Tax=Ascobolus immersus RN42 TaxID=1160509 RepID=A0A3N4IIS2_ASCIM|nr:hypothetical protein BJ508DRAFT_373208 [Ascobolus immersus RN42]